MIQLLTGNLQFYFNPDCFTSYLQTFSVHLSCWTLWTVERLFFRTPVNGCLYIKRKELFYFFALSKFLILWLRLTLLLLFKFSPACILLKTLLFGSMISCPFFGAVMQWLPILHNFIKINLNSGSAHVQTLLAARRRFTMVRISGNKAKRLSSIIS